MNIDHVAAFFLRFFLLRDSRNESVMRFTNSLCFDFCFADFFCVLSEQLRNRDCTCVSYEI